MNAQPVVATTEKSDLTSVWVLIAMSTEAEEPIMRTFDERRQAEVLINRWVMKKRRDGWQPGNVRWPVFVGDRETNATFFHPNKMDWAFIKLVGPDQTERAPVASDDDLPI